MRDPHVWAGYLDEAIELFGDAADVLFAQHHWPRWGTDRIVDFLAKQRDLYGYIHDQTLRLLNQGYVAAEIAEQLELPPSLEREWHCRGYYGSLNHNVKAVYQRYLGWFDGNPAHLWPHPPEAAGERYVALAGGRRRRCSPTRARRSSAGDFRWVAEVVNHLVFADPEQRRGEGAAGAGARAARLRRRERHLAQLLPDGRPRAAPRRRRDRGRDPAADFVAQPHPRAALRRASRSRSTGRAPATARSRCTGVFTDTGDEYDADAAARRADPPPGAPARPSSTRP